MAQQAELNIRSHTETSQVIMTSQFIILQYKCGAPRMYLVLLCLDKTILELADSQECKVKTVDGNKVGLNSDSMMYCH